MIFSLTTEYKNPVEISTTGTVLTTVFISNGAVAFDGFNGTITAGETEIRSTSRECETYSGGQSEDWLQEASTFPVRATVLVSDLPSKEISFSVVADLWESSIYALTIVESDYDESIIMILECQSAHECV